MVYATEQTTLVIDQNQARTQLQMLGYKPGDNVYMRFFVPDGDPRHGTPAAARKANKLNWKEVERYQNDGYGVYFVINSGGHADKDVQQGRALFCEWDDRPIEDQIFAWQELKLPEPTMQVSTRKSVHNYWRADLTKEQWIELQQDLLAYTQSDQKLKNPSRVLRLAGCWHIKPGCEPVRCDIIHQSGKVYTYEELRAIIPQRQEPEQPTINYQPSVSDDVPLYQFLTKDDRALIDQGSPQGSRNGSGAKLARNLIGTVQRLNHLGIRYSGNSRQLFDDYSYRCNPPLSSGEAETIWKSAQKDNPTPSLSDNALENCAKAWLRNQEKGANSSYKKPSERVKQNVSVTGDSIVDGDSHNVDIISIADTVTTVTEILKSGFQDWMEINKLEDVRVKSELSNKQAFYALVNGIKSQFDEVQPEDEIRLKALIDWHNTELDFHKALPSMADDILHDAKVLNIDPIGIWQYLLPAVLSLAGKRVNLDVESHEIPAIAWTAIIAESGTGKTRGEKLVTSPLKQLQKKSRERFQAELAEWEETIANWEKGDGKKPPKPVERKYLFDVATIQAVMRRQSEQGLNGSLWARDELVGIFQSMNQFNKGETEALSCLIASWDGSSSQVDRVNQEDSYFLDASRLSIAGGLQPGVFKKAFKDPDDSQGLQARFLFAAMKPKKPKRTKGFCRLSEKLPPMYQWVDTLREGKIKLSVEADQYYDKLYEAIGEQAFNTSMPAIRAWMFKLPTQLLRIALGLHLIECYHDSNRPLWTLQKDTLERAVLFAQYYRSTFHVVQTTAADTNDISSILLQIWDKAITRHPEGISTRDAYREIKAIQFCAKDAGRPVCAYTADLFSKLEQMGKGTVLKKGRQIKFVANLTPPPLSPNCDDGAKSESLPIGDRVTIAETIVTSQTELSSGGELSPVPVPVIVVANVPQNEVLKEVEETITIASRDQKDPGVDEKPADVLVQSEEKYTLVNVGANGWGEVVQASSQAPTPQPLELDWKQLIARTDAEMSRLGWSTAQAKAYLKATYGKRSRQLLTDAEILDFLRYLEPQPNPSPESEIASTANAEVADATPQVPPLPQKPSIEVTEDTQFQPGDRVKVETDIRSLESFNGREGIVIEVKETSAQCLIDFGEGEFMHIPFRGMLKQLIQDNEVVWEF